MKSFVTAGLTGVIAASLLGGAALAQPRHDYDRHDDGRRMDGRYDDHHGGGRHWGRGQRLDGRYGAYQPVDDWRAQRLAAPRRGYHWVRSGDDYVLAAVTTGLIASVIAANR